MELKKSRRERGFSLIEVLISAGILMFIAVGLIPLFTTSIVMNQKGGEATTSTNLAKSRMEELMRLPFEAPELTIAGGQTESKTEEYFSEADQVWKPGTPPGAADLALWTRTTVIHQYNVRDLSDGTPLLDNPLDGNALTTEVQLKGIEVTVESTRKGGALGIGKKITLRTYKPF